MKKFFLISVFLFSQLAFATQELTLYFIPSPHGIDWSTPATLAQTAVKNKFSFKSHFMGHVWVEIKCGRTHELTGMTDHNPDYFFQLLIERRGLGVLFHSFDGQMEKKADILKEMPELFKEGRINFITFKVNQSQCERAIQYVNEYRKFNVGRFYGLANRPRYGEGSGCSAFGASFVDVLNFIDQDIKDSWSHSINIPLELAGPPLTEEKVSLFKILFNARSWAKEDEKHQKLFFWDPDKMYKWVKRKISEKQNGFTIKKVEQSEGVIVDKSNFPTPVGPIWLQRLNPKNEKETLNL